MNIIDKTVIKIDDFQQAHRPTAFLYAVIKKYGDDQTGYQTALVTYFSFLSLFPMLLVLTTVAGIIGQHNPEFGHRIVKSATNYFPAIGQSLDNSVHGLNKGGPALILGLLFTLYGARGAADAFRNAVNHIWHIPAKERAGFPKSLLRSLSLVVGGGGGFLLASVVTGLASAAGRGILFRLLTPLVNTGILYLTFVFVFKLSLPSSIGRSKVRLGALISAVGITLLQTVGGYVVASQSKHLTSSYSALFATTLGLLAWIYLQAQVILYAVQIDTVRDNALWPRSLSGKRLTRADKKINKK